MVAAFFQPLNRYARSRGARNNPGQRMKYEAEQQDLESALHPLINPEHTSTARQAQPLRAELQRTQCRLGPEREATSHVGAETDSQDTGLRKGFI